MTTPFNKEAYTKRVVAVFQSLETMQRYAKDCDALLKICDDLAHEKNAAQARAFGDLLGDEIVRNGMALQTRLHKDIQERKQDAVNERDYGPAVFYRGMEERLQALGVVEAYDFKSKEQGGAPSERVIMYVGGRRLHEKYYPSGNICAVQNETRHQGKIELKRFRDAENSPCYYSLVQENGTLVETEFHENGFQKQETHYTTRNGIVKQGRETLYDNAGKATEVVTYEAGVVRGTTLQPR